MFLFGTWLAAQRKIAITHEGVMNALLNVLFVVKNICTHITTECNILVISIPVYSRVTVCNTQFSICTPSIKPLRSGSLAHTHEMHKKDSFPKLRNGHCPILQ